MSKLQKVATIAGVAVISAVVSAQTVLLLGPRAPELRAAKAEWSLALRQADSQPAPDAAMIAKSADGHFWTRGLVNGEPVRFLVDTGATAVALTPADAQRLGFHAQDLEFGSKVVTAGGQARAASVKLRRVSIAGAELEDVDALVIEKGLDTSLLGMSYLGRLTRFEADGRGLVLQR